MNSIEVGDFEAVLTIRIANLYERFSASSESIEPSKLAGALAKLALNQEQERRENPALKYPRYVDFDRVIGPSDDVLIQHALISVDIIIAIIYSNQHRGRRPQGLNRRNAEITIERINRVIKYNKCRIWPFC